ASAPPAETRTIAPEDTAPEGVGLRLAGSERAAVAVFGDRWAVAAGEDVLTGDWDPSAAPALAAGLVGLDVAGHDLKGLPDALLDAGLDGAHDTLVAAYLLEPRRRGYPIDE